MKDPYAHAGSRQSLLGPAPSAELIERYSTELQVNKGTPPAFLLTTSEDGTVPAENSLGFYAAMLRAGAPAELHAYEKGPHGFGLRPGFGPVQAGRSSANNGFAFTAGRTGPRGRLRLPRCEQPPAAPAGRLVPAPMNVRRS